MISQIGVSSSTRILFYNPNELSNRLNLLLQKIEAGNNSDIIIENIVAIADKLLKNKCISTKQYMKLYKNFKQFWVRKTLSG